MEEKNKNINRDTGESTVFNKKESDTDQSLLLEQYKVYVESANLTSGFRNQANTFFLTINTTLVGFIVGILEFVDRPSTSLWTVFACLAGVILGFSWFFSIKSYRALNSGRFAVIHELEARLPARVYKREWELITGRNPMKRKYLRQTYIEQVIPLAFCVLYFAIVVTLIVE